VLRFEHKMLPFKSAELVYSSNMHPKNGSTHL
jgi:hypothetical protein